MQLPTLVCTSACTQHTCSLKALHFWSMTKGDAEEMTFSSTWLLTAFLIAFSPDSEGLQLLDGKGGAALSKRALAHASVDAAVASTL